MEYPTQDDLRHRIRRACLEEEGRRLTFIIGSGASRGAVPTTSEMVVFFRNSIADHQSDLSDFDERIGTGDPANQYQAAARFLIDRAGLPHLNRVIRLAVLRSRVPAVRPEIVQTVLRDDERLRDLEDDDQGWAVPQGTAALARLISRLPLAARGSILTTNFDPLVEVALASNGLLPMTVIADGDGAIPLAADAPPGVVQVAHLHGHWRVGDTLHTSAQLGTERPRLAGSLRQILTNSICIVLGYGGWDDILTRTLMNLVEEGAQHRLEVLWASHGREPAMGLLTPSELPGRIQPYVGVDINSLLPAADNDLSALGHATQVKDRKRRNQITLSGFTLIDRNFRALETHRVETDARVLSFFEGREASWADVFGGRAAQLDRLQPLRAAVKAWNFELPGQLIIGPTGEGKSTGLRQLAAELVDDGSYRVWWANAGGRIDTERTLELSETSVRNCLFVDDADLHVQELTSLLTRIAETGRSDMRVIMAARDTDWQRATARHALIRQRCSTHFASGISRDDAQRIVEKWAALGARGLADLVDVGASITERATYLYEKSLGSGDNALLGALLSTRHGSELREHVTELMTRLARVDLPNEHTLLDAYLIVCIAAASGIGAVSVEHLSWALDLSLQETVGLAVNPLGHEAATHRHGNAVMPRHPAIAEAAVDLANAFDRDTTEVLRQFVARVTTRSVGASWGEETLSVVFAGQRMNDARMAVAACKGAVEGDPSQLRLRCAHIGVLRHHGLIDDAAAACNEAHSKFDRSTDLPIATRPFYIEWARVAGLRRDHRFAAAINACALLDLPDVHRLDRNQAGRALSGLSLSLAQLDSSDHPELVRMVGVCAEEAINAAPDSATRAQAEKTVRLAELRGFQSPTNLGDRVRLVKASIETSIRASDSIAVRPYRRRVRETNDLMHIVAM